MFTAPLLGLLLTDPVAATLHVESNAPNIEIEVLEVVSDGVVDDLGIRRGVDHRQVCVAPCHRSLATAKLYRFGGDGLRTSQRFSLAGRGADITAYVRPGRTGVFVGGAIFTAVGVATMLGGVAWIAVANVFSGPGDTGEPGVPPDYRPGTALLASGGAVLAGGITMLVLGRTRVAWAKRGLGILRPLRFG